MTDKNIRVEDFVVFTKKNGLLYAEYKPNIKIDLDTAKAIVEARKEFTKNKPHRAVVFGGPFELTAPAKKYAYSPESTELIEAWAIISQESVLKNAFLKLLYFSHGRKRKTGFFTNIADAEKWLKNLVIK
jgi:hypothetical protein